jgi:hypothetical protein
LASIAFVVLAINGCSSDTTSSDGDSSAPGPAPAPAPGAVLHPQYPALDLRTLPLYGTAAFTYEVPQTPNTGRSVTIGTTGAQAAAELVNECAQGNVAITVPDSAGDIGVVILAGVHDCDITLGPNVRIQSLTLCRLAYSYCAEPNPPPLQPSQRVRVRGGQLGSVAMHHNATDVVLDGVIVNNGIVSSTNRPLVAVNMVGSNRVAVVNSLIRMLPVDRGAGVFDGHGFLAVTTRNVIVANNNIVTAGNHDSWGFRLGGATNWIITDNTVRVSYHKLVRLNDNDSDYVYIKGGVWMRDGDAASTAVDSFTNLGNGTSTDRVYVHDVTVYMSPAGSALNFGVGTANQVNGLWEARRIHWIARHANVVSDAILTGLANGYCGADDNCDYGIGTHSYTYDSGLTLPTNAWRTISGFAYSDPDQLPVVP